MIVTRGNVSGKKNTKNLSCVSHRSIDGSLENCTIARIHEKSTERTGHHLRWYNRASWYNYNSQSVNLAATEAVPWFSLDKFSIRTGTTRNRFSFSAGRTATRHAALRINSWLTFAALALSRTYRYDHMGWQESGAVAVRFRHSIYRKDGDIMQSMGMPGCTHARAHKEPS